jgi:glycosyltransferase involved in cell wall biosynthesis
MALTVVAPAQTTLDFWRGHGDLPARDTVVLPHAQLTPRGPAGPSAHRRFRLGFLGVPTPLKGWPLFRELAERLADDPRYRFHHLGARPDPAAPASFHPVVATPLTPQAMQDAAEALELDAALIWPLCRETFSFTAHEAAAAGAAVITGPDSGNVAAFVRETGLGRVLPDETALAEAFVSGEILALARDRRDAMLYDLAYSGLTADLVAAR